MNPTNRSLIALIVLLFTALSLSAAAILTIPQPVRADLAVLYAAPTAVGSGDCSSWTNPCTLQTALANSVSGDEIWVHAGVHYPGTNRTDNFTLMNGVAVYGGFAGTEASRAERDWQTNVTILSGDIDGNDTNTDGNFIAETPAHIQGSNAYHVVSGGLTNNTAVLDGFVVTAGQATGASPFDLGGGMYNQDASPQLSNLVFSGNTSGAGGGMYNTASHPLLTDVTFSGNTSTDGGGMYNDHYSTPTMTRVTFDSNTATGYGGGMALGGDHTDPVLQGVVFSNNTAGAGGGGVYVGVYNSTGGVYTDVIFRSNTAGEGGGMYNSNISPILTNVIFNSNVAQYGGGMHNYSSAVELTNVTFTGNTASIQGGAMYSWWNRGPLLKNATLWGNSAPDGPEIYTIYVGDATVSHSDIQGCAGSGAGWNSMCGIDSGGNIDADPLFVDVANGNLRLDPDSPAIDAGDNTAVPADAFDQDGDGNTTEPLPRDLDGVARFADSPEIIDTGNGTAPIVDMGAYEFQSAPPAPVVAASCSGNNVLLTCAYLSADITHQVWRSSSPNFVPVDEGTDLGDICTDDGVTVTCTHENAIGDPSANSFYVLRALFESGAYTDSNQTGVFGFTLTPGN